MWLGRPLTFIPSGEHCGAEGLQGPAVPGPPRQQGEEKTQENYLKPVAGRYCWSSAQKRWVKVTEPSKTWVCKSGLWCCCLAHRWMLYWGGNTFIIPASFMVTVCGKGKRNTGCETTSVHSGHFCSCFMQNVFFLFSDLNIDLMGSVCVKTGQKPRQR